MLGLFRSSMYMNMHVRMYVAMSERRIICMLTVCTDLRYPGRRFIVQTGNSFWDF